MSIEAFLEKELPNIHKQFQEGFIKSEDFLIAVNRYLIQEDDERKKTPFRFRINHNVVNKHYDDDNDGYD